MSVVLSPSAASRGRSVRAEPSHSIVALLPSAPDARLEDFQPIVSAQEGAWMELAPPRAPPACRAPPASPPPLPTPAECVYYAETAGTQEILSEVEIVTDPLLEQPVVELLGPQARLVIPCRADLPYLVLQLKDLNKFTSVEVAVVDDTKRVRRLKLSNRVSAARVDANTVTMPLLLEDGVWNYVCLDLPTLSSAAFGATFRYCKEVVVTSNVAVARVFFQDKRYEDAELPPFLRVIT